MIFKNCLKLTQWEPHTYNDGLGFNFRTRRTYLGYGDGRIRLQPVSQFITTPGVERICSVHQEFRVDNGALSQLPLAISVLDAQTGTMSWNSSGVRDYGTLASSPRANTFTPSSKQPQEQFLYVDSSRYEFGYNSNLKLFLLHNKGVCEGPTRIFFRPYAIVMIGAYRPQPRPDLQISLAPKMWSIRGLYGASGTPTDWGDWYDISKVEATPGAYNNVASDYYFPAGYVNLIHDEINQNDMRWKVYEIKSPLSYMTSWGGNNYYLTMPALTFYGGGEDDLRIAFLEYGCEFFQWQGFSN